VVSLRESGLLAKAHAGAIPTRYRTINWPEYNASLPRRGSLSVWFDPDMNWYARKVGKRDHHRTSNIEHRTSNIEHRTSKEVTRYARGKHEGSCGERPQTPVTGTEVE